MEPASQEITLLLNELGQGHKAVEARLLPMLYGELHKLARQRLGHEQKAASLQPTELVNEAYLKLLAQPDRNWESRSHFFATASRAMRNILIDYIRNKQAEKRGGGLVRVELGDCAAVKEEDFAGLLALHEALNRLEALDPEQARIVELRYFARFTMAEIAELLGVSVRRVEREWEYARNWLHSQLTSQVTSQLNRTAP